jgi:hypothetical protein
VLSSPPITLLLLGAVAVPIRLTKRDQCTRSFCRGGSSGDSMRAFFFLRLDARDVDTGSGIESRCAYAMSIARGGCGETGCGESGASAPVGEPGETMPPSSCSSGERTPGESVSGGEVCWLLERRQFHMALIARVVVDVRFTVTGGP